MDIHAKLLVVSPVCGTALFTLVLSLAASLPDRKTLSRLEPHPLELPDLPLTSLEAVLERLVSLPPFSVCLLKQPRRNSFQRNQRVLTGVPRKVKPSKANCLYLQVM